MLLDSISTTNAGCPTSRSFFARCGIPPRSSRASDNKEDVLRRPAFLFANGSWPQPPERLRNKSALLWELRGERGGIPHLAKNERDVGHPALVVGIEPKARSLPGHSLEIRPLEILKRSLG